MKNVIKEVVFINNTIAPYRIPLFNSIIKLFKKESIKMKVFFYVKKKL